MFLKNVYIREHFFTNKISKIENKKYSVKKMNKVILILFLSQLLGEAPLFSASPIEQEKPIEHLWNQTSTIVDQEKFDLIGGDMAVPKV